MAMRLEDDDLRQIDDATLERLREGDLRTLSKKMLADLKEARERLKQSPQNSSRPPSSRAPWEKRADAEEDAADSASTAEADEQGPPASAEPEGDTDEDEPAPKSPPNDEQQGEKPTRRPSRKKGMPGYGRTQRLAVTETVHHHPESCALCSRALSADGGVWTAFETVDIEVGAGEGPGIGVTNTHHVYHEATCSCGHTSRARPHRADDDPLWETVALSEWRLVGPTLCALVIALTFRSRLSRPRVREFLWDWLGISLSVGTVQRCIEEAGRAADPVEEQLVEAVLASDLLHADETPHKEGKLLQWLWVFVTASTALFYVGYRSKEIVENLLGTAFSGWLMSDGYAVYRHYRRRLRCWAHLVRKARGLKESLDESAQGFGKHTIEVLETLMDAVYAAREGPQGDLKAIHAQRLDELHTACRRMQDSLHDKARALAVELLNDWEAIFIVLEHPHLPLTNNEAERALRHWVIWRRISYGTRTPVGSKSFALLASVIDTCRRRNASPWPYLAQVIAARRRGLDAPLLPPAEPSLP